MSDFVELFKEISCNSEQPYQEDNNYIERQLIESICPKQSTLDQIQKFKDINKQYDLKRKNLQDMYDQLLLTPAEQNNLMISSIENLMAGFEKLRKKSLKKIFETKVNDSEAVEQRKQSIYHQSIIESVLNKLNNPSGDLEFGLAMGILLHNDPNYHKDNDYSIDSQELLKKYCLKELHKAETNSQKIFEEHLICLAKTILLNVLSDRAISLSCEKKDFIIIPKPNTQSIKLIDTDIRHSFIVTKL